MSKHETITENDYDDQADFDVADSDFGFLIDSDGNLKTVFGPDDLFDAPPENVQKILDMFGVDSTELLIRSGTTIH